MPKRRAPPFPKTPFIFDGGKPNSVSLIAQTGRSFISSRFRGTPDLVRARPWCDQPEDQPRTCRDMWTGCPSSVLSCTAWGFSSLANCFASGELLPRLFTLTCTLLPKNRRCLFCDTLRHRDLATATPACFTRHAAVWCSDFPLASLAARQRSSAIVLVYHRLREKTEAPSCPIMSITCSCHVR